MAKRERQAPVKDAEFTKPGEPDLGETRLAPSELEESEEEEAEEEDEGEDEDEDEDDDSFYDDDDLLDDDDLDDGPLLRTGSKRSGAQEALDDPDVKDLNNPFVTNLSAPPMLGRKGKSELFGETAQTFGRATSPKLYASAGQFEQCAQFRVWKMENGLPVGMGAIDSEATEEDFVRTFYSAMPKEGQGRVTFRFRPLDGLGNEMGKEFAVNISEHHKTLREMREMEKRNQHGPMGMGMMGGFGGMGGGNPWGQPQPGPRGDVYVQGGAAESTMAEEMGRMFEAAVDRADEQAKHLRASLEMERERLREEEKARAQERISMAERVGSTTEQMMTRLMESDRLRSEEAMKASKQHSDTMMSMLTGVFTQQQAAAQAAAERAREQDAIRLQQDREYFERQRQEAEERRRNEREEYERKREYELQQQRLEAERREREMEQRRETEKEEMRLRLEREKMEMEQRREELRIERERIRQEMEERRERDRLEWERKQAIEREERERRERAERERWEREKMEMERKRQDERAEWERREALRREEMARESERRQMDIQIQLKQMEMDKERAREHQERMAEQARLEREAQREAADRREKLERLARDEAERARQRQHDMELKRLEAQQQADREHAERMIQLTKLQNSGGLSGLTDMLGMETPELLSAIFGGKDDEEGGWSDTLAKVLGGVVDMGKVVMQQQGQGGPGQPGQPQVPQLPMHDRTQGMIPIQTPQGVRMLTPGQVEELKARQAALSRQAMQAAGNIPTPAEEEPEENPFMPSDAEEVEEEADHAPQELLGEDYLMSLEVDTDERAENAGMSSKEIRKARKGLKILARKLRKKDEAEWEGIITAAVLTTPEIFGYVQAVTAYAAFAETGAEPELVEAVIAAMRASSSVPEGTVPYTEADYEAMNGENPDQPEEAPAQEEEKEEE